ncbi:MAG: hypothetical protein KAU58_06985 [Candidatus Omnitrophica bacterium]|nr:hypothetical protein [Candidatus Omnitrophota bacterium]
MSIIAEALKKAEKNSAVLRPPAGLHRKRPISKFFLIFFAILSSGSVYFYIITKNANTIQATNQVSEVIKIEEIKQDIVKKPAETTERNAVTAPSLKGIMHAKNKPLAVINDIMMGEDEEIGDIKVVKIRPASVDVERNGRILTLRLKR